MEQKCVVGAGARGDRGGHRGVKASDCGWNSVRSVCQRRFRHGPEAPPLLPTHAQSTEMATPPPPPAEPIPKTKEKKTKRYHYVI